MKKLVSTAALLTAGGVLAVRGRERWHAIQAVDPVLRSPLLWLPGVVVSRSSIPLVRRVPNPPRPKLPDGVSVTHQTIPGADGAPDVPVLVVQPKPRPEPAPALLWIHGGGTILGTPENDVVKCAEFAAELGAVVIATSYRLAPENPFPAAADDCFSSWRWLTSPDGGIRQLGLDPDRIALGGASAGGLLASLVAHRIVDRDAHQPCLQLLVYPMLDDRSVLRPEVGRRALLWTRTSNEIGWSCFLGRHPEWDRAPEGAVPARRADLSGLPPTWIGVGELDLFYGEDLEYARRLREAGVECELVEVPRAYHGFDIMTGTDPVRGFQQAQLAALRRAFGLTSGGA